MNAVLGPIIFIHTVETGLIIGIGICQVLVLHHASGLGILIGWLYSIFIACFAGQKLTDEFDSIRDELFGQNWYDRNVVTQKEVRYMLTKLMRPIYLKNFAFGVVNLEMFMTIMKSAYSYLTLFAQTL